VQCGWGNRRVAENTEGHDMRFLVNFPTFPGPIPLPGWATKEVPNNDKHKPKGSSQRKDPDGKFPISVVIFPNAMRALIKIRNGHQANDNQRWQYYSSDPRIKVDQQFLQTDKIPGSFRWVRSLIGISERFKRGRHHHRPHP